LTPRLVINASRGAVATAVDGRGITRVFSYEVAEHLRRGELEIVLGAHEHPPVPVHLIMPPGRLSVPKIRAFVDFAVPRLRNQFARLAGAGFETGENPRLEASRMQACKTLTAGRLANSVGRSLNEGARC
jgi:DNA-binding transcriptional LysR family regulator